MDNRVVATGARFATTRRISNLARMAICALVLPGLLLSVGTTESNATPAAPMAAAEVLYGVAPSEFGLTLVTVAPVDTTAPDFDPTRACGINFFGAPIGIEGITGLAFDGRDTLYGVTNDLLVLIDPDSGVRISDIALVGTTVVDISRRGDGQIFGVGFLSDTSWSLGNIDKVSGVFAPVGTSLLGELGEGNALAFTSVDTLYNATGTRIPDITYEFCFAPGSCLPPKLFPASGTSNLLRLDHSNVGPPVPDLGEFIGALTDSGAVALNGGYTSMAAAADDTMFATRTFVLPEAAPGLVPVSPPSEEHSLVTIELVADAADNNIVTPICDTSPGLDGLAFRPPPETPGGPVTFASFDVNKLDLKKRKGDFDLRATFFLDLPPGGASDGADIIGERFTLEIGTYILTLEPGSFRAKGKIRDDDDPKHRKGRFEFKMKKKRGKKKKHEKAEELDIRIDVFGDGRYEIRAKGKGVELDDPSNDVPVTLTIGDDSGTLDVHAKIHR